MSALKAPVIQDGRDRAAAYYYSSGGPPSIVREIINGNRDGWFRVQAFAQYRLASQSELRDALQWALDELNGKTRYDEDVADQQIENCYAIAEAALAKATGGAAPDAVRAVRS